ncbi:MAG: glycosyltransferase family 1 protein [Sphingobacteriales bacterium]|nr:MAG: glycosyltransferase family 1 protein [Sphingobacteriales bacterium]
MFIVHVVEPFASGIATFIRSLVENLPQDYHVIIHGERQEVMDSDEVKKLFPKNNIRFIHWKSVKRNLHPYKDAKAFLELYQILKRFRHADAVHLHSSKSGFIGRLVCKMLGFKNVIYTPNGAPFLMNDGLLKRSLYRQLEKIGASFGGRVVCVSASEAEAYHNIGVSASFINNGTKVYNERLEEGKDDLTGKFIIAFTGRITAQKNPERFNQLAHKFLYNKQLIFLWIGDGEERHKLTAPNIHITGWLSEADVRQVLARASIYLSTSYYEGLSFGVLEAMSMAKPMILSNCTGNRDIIRYGVNGDLFDTVEQAYTQILYYINNPTMLKAMGNYSRDLCQSEFSAEASADNYRMVYSL